MTPGIPRGGQAPHINFSEFFDDEKVEPLLQRVYVALETEGISDIVLNFEKCRWFELLPLARLLALLCCQPRRPTLHIVGPAGYMLPYYYHHVERLGRKLLSPGLSSAEQERLEARIAWFSKQLPLIGMRAGAFLVAWRALDLLSDHYVRHDGGACRWYVNRQREVSLSQLRDQYMLAYGSAEPGQSPTSARIWPFTRYTLDDQAELLARTNGDEFLSGPLRAHLRSRVIGNGLAQNVFFFEPFENVFLHAYPDPADTDGAIVSMRVLDRPEDRQRSRKTSRPRSIAQRGGWYRQFLQQADSSLMEIVIADGGVGIPSRLEQALRQDMSYQRRKGFSFEALDLPERLWELIRYAFEEHSTRRESPPPGLRGLSWLRRKLAELQGGLIHVVSRGVTYAIVDRGTGLVEIPFDPGRQVDLPGTAIRILLPLRKAPDLIDHRPQWRIDAAEPAPLLSPVLSTPSFTRFVLPLELDSQKDEGRIAAIFEEFFMEIAQRLESEPDFAVIDFDHRLLTRSNLEHLLSRFLESPVFFGRVICVNCDRHLTRRLETLIGGDALAEKGLVVPFFEPDLSLFWVGAQQATRPDLEKQVLEAFSRGFVDLTEDDLRRLADANPRLFSSRTESAAYFSFSLDDLEHFVRERLGQRLLDSLEERGAIHRGRFILPRSQRTVPTYVEPHELFVDSGLAKLLGRHLAVLLRRHYRDPALATRRLSFRVLTATRIGREIAMWMPEGYRSRFVYTDYYLVRPEKLRLLKYLRGRQVVIVVDIISTGSLVEQLLGVCGEANASVLGVLSFIDMSPSTSVSSTRTFLGESGKELEHLTFWRHPQMIDETREGDRRVDPYTLSLAPIADSAQREAARELSIFSPARGLRLLADAKALHFGHFDIFGRHYDFATNLLRLISIPSLERDDIYHACEDAILSSLPPFRDAQHPTAIVLYPDLSHCHILQASLLQRPRIQQALRTRSIRFKEARRGSRAHGNRYWLTVEEVQQLRDWAKGEYPSGYAVLLLDDAASSGETLLALLELARSLDPAEVRAFVLLNRMPHLRTDHHQGIERFEWAPSRFASLIHLDLPAFAREACPLCKERNELSFDLRSARSDWFRAKVQARLDRLEITTSLNPQDEPSGILSEPVPGFHGFLWDDEAFLGIASLPAVTRAISARLAIHGATSLLEVLDEVSDQPSEEVWRVTAIEIARRTDLQQAQHVESILLDRLIRVLSGRFAADRQASAVEALRYFRPEALMPKLVAIMEAVLRRIPSEDLLTELLLLLRRTLSYRHFPGADVLTTETRITTLLDEQLTSLSPASVHYQRVALLRHEWQGGSLPQYNVVEVIRGLNALLAPFRRKDHRLLARLEEYIAGDEWKWNDVVRATIGGACSVTRLAKVLVSRLTQSGSPPDRKLEESVKSGTAALAELRDALVAQITDSSPPGFARLRQLMDDLKDAIDEVQSELFRHTLDPGPILKGLVASVASRFPQSDLKVGVKVDLPPGTRIVVDPTLFSEIAQNLTTNLRYALDPSLGKLEAHFSWDILQDHSRPSVVLRVQCKTRGAARFSDEAGQLTTTEKLRQRGTFYGVEREDNRESYGAADSQWEEAWSFWRLET